MPICAKIVEYLLITDFGSVAQLVEQWPFKPFVAGSNPAGPTIKIALGLFFIACNF